MASHESQLTFIAYTVIIILNTGILANKSADRLSIIGNRNDSGSMENTRISNSVKGWATFYGLHRNTIKF